MDNVVNKLRRRGTTVEHKSELMADNRTNVDDDSAVDLYGTAKSRPDKIE